MSNNLDITVDDFGNICRTCLSRENLKPLYENCSRSTCLAEMLMSCTLVKFSEDDGLPAKICINCIKEINQAFFLAKRCETTDTILRECVKMKTGLENNSSQSQTIEPIIKAEVQTEIILPNILLTVEEVLDEFEYIKIKQETDAKIEHEEYMEEVKKEEDEKIERDEVKRKENAEIEEEEYMEEIKQEKTVKIENEYDETNDDPAVENYEEDVDEDQDEMYSEKSDNPASSPRRMSTNFQIKDGSLKHDDGAVPVKKSKNKLPYYECKKCCARFPDFKSIKKHREEVKHPPYVYNPSTCSICNKVIGYRSMKQHVRTHTGEKPYSCEICGTRYSTNSNLNEHKRNRHSEIKEVQTQSKDYQCSQCDQTFLTKRLLRRHIATHGEKKFACTVCGKRFISEDLLNYHIKVHKGERKYACDVCGKVLSCIESFNIHKRIHTGEKPHVCSICSKAFTHITSLRNHMKIHTGEKPFTCGVCNKAYTQGNNLKFHMITHTGENPYVCSVCSKAFANATNLKNHMRIHTGETSYACEVCSRIFTQSDSLKRHMRTHTGEKPFSCEVCCKSFATNGALTIHTRTHTGETPYICSFCGKGFCTSSAKKKHERIHGEQNLVPPFELVKLPTLSDS